jgi:uncharacterized phiE125 gp8 family phage protein
VNVAWSRTVEPAAGNEPVTLTEAKAQLRQTLTTEDTYIGTLIVAARNLAEEYLARGLFTQTWKLTQDRWSDEIWLPRAAPLQSVSSVKYYDDAGTLQTLATSVYLTDSTSEPARIVLAPYQIWPTLQANRAGAVEVTYVVGWTDVPSIPQAIKLGLQLLIGHLYAHRGDNGGVVPGDVATVWAPYRTYWRPPSC